MKTRLAIFDLDGTLFDTSDVNFFAYKSALAFYGIDLDRDYFMKDCFGRHYKDFLPGIMGNSDHMEEVHAAKIMEYPHNLDKARINHHLFRMIGAMRDEYHTAIVTTASRKNVDDILGHVGYVECFDYVLTQENMLKKKPDPEGFITAMKHFGISAENTVIFEDSDVGIEAAHASGASVFIVDRF